MKNLILFVLLFSITTLFAQKKKTTPNLASWEQFEKLNEDGLYKDALNLLTPLLDRAIKENNVTDFQKALNKYRDIVPDALLENDEKLALLNQLENKIDQTKVPLNNIGHLFLANLYRHYNYVWELNDEFSLSINKNVLKNNDDAINYHFQKALVQFSELINYNAAGIHSYYESDSLTVVSKPTLLDIYLNEIENEFGQSDYNDTTLFYQTENLLKYPKDTILSLYYQLENFHWKNKNYYAFVETVLDRIDFILSRITNPALKKNSDYTWLLEKVKNTPAALKIILKQAGQLAFLGDMYDWKQNPIVKNKKEEAVKLLEQGCKDHPTSLYYREVQELIFEIKNKQLNAEIKEKTLLNEPNILSITYKNIDSVHLSVFHIDKISNDTTKNFFKNYQLRQVHQEALTLDKNGLYNKHTKDFILPEWKQTGKFLVMISENEKATERITTEDSIDPFLKCSYIFIEVHDFTVLYKAENGNGIIHVLDLKTGKPKENAQVEVFFKNIKNDKKHCYITNKYGECQFTLENSEVYWKVCYKEDSLSNSMYSYSNYRDSEELQYKIVTDRAIYRPGQTVHYKIIAYKGASPIYSVVPNQPIQVLLQDKNGLKIYEPKEVNSLGLTNSFGSYSGSFVLPKNGFSLGYAVFIVNQKSSERIQIEEYKRPTFFIETSFKKQNYYHGDTINYLGNVTSFAGYPISKAKIKLNITYYYQNERDEYQTVKIDTLIKTDEKGNFTFNYTSINTKEYSVTYQFSISITNTQGETHSSSNYAYVKEKKQEWDIQIPNEILYNDTSKISFNLKELPENTKKFKLVVLKQNEKRKNTRHEFEENEFQNFSSESFNLLFPNSYYFENSKIHSYYDTILKTQKNIGDKIALTDLIQNSAGRFTIISTYIDNNEKIVNTDYLESFNLYSDKSQHLAGLWIKPSKTKPEIGETLPIIIGTRFKNQFIHYSIYSRGKLVKSENKTISKRTKINYTITKEDQDGITVQVMFVNDGIIFKNQIEIAVSQTSKKVDIQLETKRDFLSPGSKEKWKVYINSPNQFELLSTMMDASLDNLQNSYWNISLNKNYHYIREWSSINQEYQSNDFETLNDWSENWWYYLGPNGDTVQLVEYSIIGSKNQEGESDDFFNEEVGSGRGGGSGRGMVMYSKSEESMQANKLVAFAPPVITDIEVDSSPNKEEKPEPSNKTKNTPRNNFNETAFFYPNLYADKDGKFSFEFTLPDALTTWKFRALAHDKEMNMGQIEEFFIAQKELMVQPNAPRFFRAGDTLEFSANVVNVSEKNLPVKVSLEWFNPFTNEVIPEVFGKMETQNIQLNAKQSQTVSWKLSIPENGLDLIEYRIKASSESFTDSEEKAFPILSNRVFVTEALPITIEEKGNYTFTLDKLATSTSTTKQHENLVFDYASNPIWSVVKTLPTASKVNYPSSDALFHAYYTNVLGSKVLANNPAIKQMIAYWNIGASELTNPTIANSVDLTETPWVNAAKSESEQRKEIAFFLEENNLANQQKTYLEQLFQQRNMDGAWPWFTGGPASAYITNDIVFGFAQLNERPAELDASLNYLNNYYLNEFKKHTATENNQRNWLSEQELQWLYIQAVYQLPSNEFTTLLTKTLAKTWTTLSLKQQAIAGMYLVKTGDKIFATKIAASIQNRATKRKNTGTYWNEKYYSNAESIETQAYILEFFTALGQEKSVLNSIQLSLLNKKRGQLWENSSTTARVVHALISVPATDFSTKSSAIIRIGNETITKATNEIGELTQTWTKKEITPALGNVVIDQNAETPSFGSLTYSYTENIEHVTNSTTGLVLTKEIYLIQGDQEILVTPTTKLKVGDQLRIYLKVSSDRRIDFVHIKDLKAAGMENVNQLSSYGYGINVSYYTTPYDNRTSFFIEHLPKGKCNVSYDVRLTHKGTQSIGYALVECLYAPEFRGNTSGMKVVVE
jgi:uncharacterized protein YfaS (alpha-2-macroglobulin family)